MAVRVERDTVITVPSIEPGSEKRQSIELREADQPFSVRLDGSRYGDEVRFDDLREALERAESEFLTPPLRSA